MAGLDEITCQLRSGITCSASLNGPNFDLLLHLSSPLLVGRPVSRCVSAINGRHWRNWKCFALRVVVLFLDKFGRTLEMGPM